ncbi:hypothetical protein PAXINDRAFT_16856 [Paxillus involutus ATCC 200175]|uniref:Uncharacterized protein n=1 Tax=Paxillus involutus ATCC 200175 TaxID=664439 RepID=A0A0C9T3C3_PAXIN|nr:hypothetical protein PAXINDRAFT_16856 [Paxillus involutus ATCC 200175]
MEKGQKATLPPSLVQKAQPTGGEWSARATMKVFCIPVLCGVLLSYFGIVSSSLVPFPSTTISLSDFLNNQAASIDGTTGNFDKNGSTYVAEYLPRGPWTFNGTTYDLPTSWGSGNDNVVAEGQVLELPNATYVHELHIVYAGDGGGLGGNEFESTFNLNYDDNSVKELPFTCKNWWKWSILNWGDIRT